MNKITDTSAFSLVSGGLDLWEEVRLDQRQRIHDVRLLGSKPIDFTPLA